VVPEALAIDVEYLLPAWWSIAAPAATTTAAVTTASATAAATTTTATAEAAASATTTSAATSAAIFAWFGLVYLDSAAVHLCTVELRDGPVAFIARSHFNKAESA
jgi:hypothetical protein